jgi:putative membrane protein
MTKRLIGVGGLIAVSVLGWQAWSFGENVGKDIKGAADSAGNAVKNTAEKATDALKKSDQREVDRLGDSTDPRDQAKHFVLEASEANRAEIAEGKIAAAQAHNPDIKRFAQQMVDDHTAAEQQLEQVAQNLGVKLPKALNEVHVSILDNLKRKTGRDFDRHYLYGQVAEHVMAVLMFRDASEELQEQQAKQYAQQTLPKLQHHLQEAEQLANAGTAITAGGHLEGHETTNQNSK